LQTSGTAAPDFTYTAVDGKSITLSKLRGKYVYIDIWATYCVPCKEQIPFLAKLEEDYKDKNIRFVSISVDKQAQAVAWRRYVTDNKLTGYQVMADKDFKSDFIEKFNIASIPRFILIDPDGNVVDSDGKRPSDPAVKKQLDEFLK
jgi:thiol-disulfide isomerase/thioredoxin